MFAILSDIQIVLPDQYVKKRLCFLFLRRLDNDVLHLETRLRSRLHSYHIALTPLQVQYYHLSHIQSLWLHVNVVACVLLFSTRPIFLCLYFHILTTFRTNSFFLAFILSYCPIFICPFRKRTLHRMIQHPYPFYVKIVVVRTNYANTNIILKTIH